jgi:hypothetical protein
VTEKIDFAFAAKLFEEFVENQSSLKGFQKQKQKQKHCQNWRGNSVEGPTIDI